MKAVITPCHDDVVKSSKNMTRTGPPNTIFVVVVDDLKICSITSENYGREITFSKLQSKNAILSFIYCRQFSVRIPVHKFVKKALMLAISRLGS